MEKYNDRVDGFSQQEYEVLAQAYDSSQQSKNGILAENINYLEIDNENDSNNKNINNPISNSCKNTTNSANNGQYFNNDNFVYSPISVQNNNLEDNDFNTNEHLITPTPQINYVGLSNTEKRWLADLIQDLKQYYNEDYGLVDFLNGEYQETERPLLYFVSKHKLLSKIMNILCSIFDKSKRNAKLNELLTQLIILARQVNAK